MVRRKPIKRFFSWLTSSIKRHLSPVFLRPRIHHGKNVKFERQIFYYVNKERKKHGIRLLNWNDSLYYDGQRRAKEITRVFCHKNIPNGCGENIAKIPLGKVRGVGFINRTNLAHSFVNTWMKSTGHRENILRLNYSSSCIGVVKHGRYFYAVQLFS